MAALLLIQRFTNRQLLYLACLRALVAAISGGRHGWRKLDRAASVAAPPARVVPLVVVAAAPS